MNEIYVTGHRNPDTDAIVAAIAYANLRNSLGDRDYVAARIGTVNDETKKLLERFGFEEPVLIKNMRTQVQDLEFDHTPALSESVTVELAWETMKKGQSRAVPIVDGDGKVCSMLSTGDLASYDVQTISENRLEDLPLFNVLSVLEGTLVNEYYVKSATVSGDLYIAMPQEFQDQALTNPETILVCGNQPEIVEQAIKSGVNCVIISRAAIRPEWAECQSGTCIISTPLSARRVSRIIYQATPVERICGKKDVVAFHLTDYVDDVREAMLKTRYRCYPVLDEHDQVVGTLSRFHLLRPRRKKVVLVDHNEAAQSVPGLEQAEILEIIDHHRLADIQTTQPIHVRNEPVGSTNTIITSMYQESGVVPTPKMAGLMAGAILSDTVMFKSPTCTRRDIAMAQRLARIANLPLEEIGKSLFGYVAEDKTAEELLKTDYKEFHIAEQNIAVSQITCMDSEGLLPRQEEFLQVMRKLQTERAMDMVILMITDVLLEGTHLLYIGSDDIIQQAFSAEPKNQHLFLPHVMSRKKQVIPMLTALWG